MADHRSAAAPSHPAALYLLIFTAGLGFSLLGACLPDLIARFDLTNAQAGAAPLAVFAGDFTGLLLAGSLLRHARIVLPAAAAGLALAALAVATAHDLGTSLLVIFYLLGCSRVALISLPGIVMSRIATANPARAMNVIYAFFSAGVTIAPVAAGLAFAHGYTFRAPFLVLAAFAAVSALAAALGLPRADLGEGLRLGALKELLLDHRRLLIALAVMNLCYVAAENVPNSWLPQYLDQTFPTPSPLRSTLILSLFWAAVTAGRFVFAALLERGFPPRRMLALLAALAAGCLIAASVTAGRLGTEVWFVASGLFFSAQFPLIVSFTGALEARLAGPLFIIIMAMGSLGAALSGQAVGLIADALSFPLAMSLAALLSLVVLALTPMLRKE